MEEEFDDEDGDDGDGEVVASLGASEEASSGVTREAEDCKYRNRREESQTCVRERGRRKSHRKS